jgi:hypothetical protein
LSSYNVKASQLQQLYNAFDAKYNDMRQTLLSREQMSQRRIARPKSISPSKVRQSKLTLPKPSKASTQQKNQSVPRVQLESLKRQDTESTRIVDEPASTPVKRRKVQTDSADDTRQLSLSEDPLPPFNATALSGSNVDVGNQPFLGEASSSGEVQRADPLDVDETIRPIGDALEKVSPGYCDDRTRPRCGGLRELFLDRKAWQILDPRILEHLHRSKSIY